ncbi:MAG: hypothetical protein KF886_24250 [Candidatus Hydrogenedentes bacterium]|nr:hypothetical protein [Candidatus Hydrogenedentota bacterium]
MKPELVWLPDIESEYLLACLLRRLRPDAPVTVLAAPALAHIVERAAAGVSRPNVRPVAVTPGDPLPDAVAAIRAPDCVPRVMVPASLDQVPMRYRPALMPEVATHYPWIRQLWSWGFREIAFVGHGEEHVLSVPFLLDAFRDRHEGQRCFVLGNGPSLNAIDMARLKNEITLGSNRCFLGYEQWGFPCTYWGVYDKYQIEQYHLEYEAGVPHDTIKFFPAEYLPVLRIANGCPVNSVWPTGVPRAFSADPAQTFVGFTVSYMLIQIAACMGCDPIILVGMDHRYELDRRGYVRALRSARRAAARQLRGGRVYGVANAAWRAWRKGGGPAPDPALWSTENASAPTHFTERYTAGGKNRFLPPEPEEAERDFDCAQAWAASNGRRILNATPGTALESFPKADFDSLF